MRAVILLLISCLVLSSVANAAVICCGDMEKAPIEQVSETPCHDTAHGASDSTPTSTPTDHPQSADPQPQCECQGCAQFTSVANPTPRLPIAAYSTGFVYYDNLVSPAPDSIYYPPKPLS